MGLGRYLNPVKTIKNTYESIYDTGGDVLKGITGTTARRNAKALNQMEDQFFEDWRIQNEQWKKDLLGTLQNWRHSGYIKELLSPAHESRGVAMAAESARQGATATKRESTDFATSQGLGRAFVARQNAKADAEARGTVGAAAAGQNYQRVATGATISGQFAQTKADIINQTNSMELARKQGMLESEQRYQAAKQAADSQKTGILTTLAGAAVGGVFGGWSGAAVGSAVGGQLGGMPGLGAVGFQTFTASRAPNVYGFDPFLSYAYGKGPYNASGSGVTLPSTYNQNAMPSSTSVAN